VGPTAPATTVAASATSTRLSPQAVGDLLSEQFGGGVLGVVVEHGIVTVTVDPGTWQRAARFCKSDPRLRMTFFDWLSAVDEREEGFSVVVSLYSIEHRHRVLLRVMAPGGREQPVAPSLTSIYRGANWHEREVYDMYGVDFEGHPGVLPRILTVENFEGFPLRKEFLLGTREAKPWPGAKEPEERHEEAGPGQSVAAVGNAEPLSAEQKSAAAAAKAQAAEAPAQREEVEYDRALYDQLIAEGKSERIARAKAKAAYVRREKARIRAEREGETVAS
jgi:NADH-quinone oxidoreductase subunit C